MKRSLLIASLAVISMNGLGIHDHLRINRDQNRVQQNLTPVSNAEITPNRPNPIREILDDEESNFGATQEQVSSGSRKRGANDRWVSDKRRRVVPLKDINEMCKAYKRGQMSEDAKTEFCNLVLRSYTMADGCNLFEKTMQISAENHVLREFRSSIALEIGKDEQEDLLGHVKKLQEKVDSSDKAHQELRGKYDQLKGRKEYYKGRIKSLKTKQKDLNDRNIELNKLLAERDKKLKIFEYKDKIQGRKLEFLSKLCTNVSYECDIKKYVQVNLTSYQAELRREIYHFLRELSDKEEIIKKLKNVEKDLSRYLTVAILYKQNMSVSERLREWNIQSNQNIAIIDENLEKQNFRTKLKDLGGKLPNKGFSLIPYTLDCSNYLSDFIEDERSGMNSDYFYEEVKRKVKFKISDADQKTKEMKRRINEEIEFIRELRGEKVIQDFWEQISKVEYFKNIMKYVDMHLDGHYGAISKLKPYEKKNEE